MIKERRNTEKAILIGYSLGTVVSTFALATNPHFFEDKVSLFVALAPTVLMKYSNEPGYKSLSDKTMVIKGLEYFDYVKYAINDKTANQSREVFSSLDENIPFFCEIGTSLCDTDMNRETVEKSNSVDLERSDESRLNLFFKMRASTSLKNFAHMA